jgi:hypothetical protein
MFAAVDGTVDEALAVRREGRRCELVSIFAEQARLAQRVTQLVREVDDDADWRKAASLALEGAGYGVITAKDASEAMEQGEACKLGLIVLDLNLGGESGLKPAVIVEGKQAVVDEDGELFVLSRGRRTRFPLTRVERDGGGAKDDAQGSAVTRALGGLRGRCPKRDDGKNASHHN